VYALPAREYHDVTIPTHDGVELHGWFLPADAPVRGTIVQFHGNAGNVTSHFLQFAWAPQRGYAVLCFDYRGYGLSPGVPSAEGLEADALAAIHFAQHLPESQAGDKLVLYGQSLGGAVLLHALGRVRDRRRVAAVVVEGSFHSYEDAAAGVLYRHTLLFPLTGLAYATVSDRHDPAPYVAGVSPTPLLVIHGTHDPVIAPAFGRALYELGREPKELWFVDGGGHIDLLRRPEVRDRLEAYLARTLQ
jgi:fermentation-respiration switch protein FrsA (DUF1100 family)